VCYEGADVARGVVGTEYLRSTDRHTFAQPTRLAKNFNPTYMAFPRAQAMKTKLEAMTCLVR
jgi:hypothetical protein